MSKLSFAVVAIVLGFSTAALAQELTAAERTACKADYEKYCTGTMPGGGRIIAEGSPRDIASNPDSATGIYLQHALKG